ncbi:MAG: hypothetical protein J5739_05825 [Lachnospiraceae bacterium]|nr:hypothetical protein [Lachnospiraceae bacterium]
MKTVKKLIVLLTAVVMVASLSAPLSIEAASGKESEDIVTVSIFNIADWGYSERTGEYAGPMVDGKPDGMGVVELVNPMGQKYDLYASFNNGVLDGTTAVVFDDGASMVSRQHVYKNGKVTEFCEVYEESGLIYRFTGKVVGDEYVVCYSDSTGYMEKYHVGIEDKVKYYDAFDTFYDDFREKIATIRPGFYIGEKQALKIDWLRKRSKSYIRKKAVSVPFDEILTDPDKHMGKVIKLENAEVFWAGLVGESETGNIYEIDAITEDGGLYSFQTDKAPDFTDGNVMDIYYTLVSISKNTQEEDNTDMINGWGLIKPTISK